MEAGSKARTMNSVGDIAWRRLPLAALVAAVAASVANTLVYYAASGVGFILRDVLVPVANGQSPITVGAVVVASVVGTLGAAIVFAVIGLFARRPVRSFRIISVVALVVSLVAPATIPGAPLSMIASLEVMHVVAWAVIFGVLTTLVRKGDTQ